MATEMATGKARDWVATQRPAKKQELQAGAQGDRRQKKEDSRQRMRGEKKERGQAHLPNPELGNLNGYFLIEGLSSFELLRHWRISQVGKVGLPPPVL
jgi:hypothetical protein